MPKRIQRKRTKGWRMPPNTVGVARPSKWGNPFHIQDLSVFTEWDYAKAQQRAFDLFQMCIDKGYVTMPMAAELDWGEHMDRIERDIKELEGKDLACWCKPGTPCHADVLIYLANK